MLACPLLQHAKRKAEEQAAAADGAPEGVKDPEVTAEASEDAPAGSSASIVTDDEPLSIEREASTVTDDVEAAAPESARAEGLQASLEDVFGSRWS